MNDFVDRTKVIQGAWPPVDGDSIHDVLNLLQRSVALIGVYDPTETLRFTNEAFRNAYFIEPDEVVDWQTLMRRNFLAKRGTIIETDNIDAWIASVRSRRGKSPVRTYESDLHDGRFIYVTETMREDGWIIYAGTDVTGLNASERDLRLDRDALYRQSFTDELTGVSNRRHILTKLGEVIEARQMSWACLVDIDHFKKINDTYGHQVGDDGLVSFAQMVRKTVKLRDAFGRVGGEEFLILFANQTFSDARRTLKQVQTVLEDLVICDAVPDLRLKISGGITDIHPTDRQESVLARADRGLYCAKSAGRDRVFSAFSTDGDTPPARVF